MVDHQHGRPAAKAAEAPVYGLARFCGIVFMILCIDAQKPAVTQQEVDEEDGGSLVDRVLAKVDQHLLTGGVSKTWS